MSESHEIRGPTQAVVFGGAGFIGTHMLQLLIDSRKYSRVISADIGEPRERIIGVEYVYCDVRNGIDPQLGGGQPAEIFNFAAIHVTPGHPEGDYYFTNVLGAVNVCRFANDTRSREIIFTSSISIYGPSENPLDETAVPAPTSAYGRSKLSAEAVHLLWQSEAPAERRLTVVRPAVIYGRYERGNFTRLSGLLSRGAFVYPGRTDSIKSCGYVKDLISSMLFMSARNPGVSTYNFCYERRYTISEICASFCEVAGYRVPALTVPVWFMNLAVLPFEILERIGIKTGINRARIQKLWFSTNIIPRRLIESHFPYQYDLVSSLRDWKQTSTTKDFD